MGLDLKEKIAKACDPVTGKLRKNITKKCVDKLVDLSDAFPGCGTDVELDLAQCLDRAVECRVCVALNAADSLFVDCDLFDDGASNASCP